MIVAQRLEETGKQLGGGAQATIILVSGAVRAAVMEDYSLEPLGPRKLRGRSEEIEVFALEGAPPLANA